VPESDLGIGVDSIVDPSGHGPRIWVQLVPEKKLTKNRLHFDVAASGGISVPMELRNSASTPRLPVSPT